MKHLLTCACIFASFLSHSQLTYPPAPSGQDVDIYFDEKFIDEYRLLEDEKNPKTLQWIYDQAGTTKEYLASIPFRLPLKNRLFELYDYPRQGRPKYIGDKWMFYRNDGLQNHSVLYIAEDLDKEAEVLIDPNKFSKDGSISLAGTYPSPDGKYLAYSISQSGSDWKTILIKDIESGKDLSDTIRNVKFSGATWYQDGFYYARYDRDPDNQMSAVNDSRKLFYHKLGTSQNSDEMFYRRKDDPKISFGLQITDDERFMFLYHYRGTSENNDLFYYDLKKKKLKKKPIKADMNSSLYVVDYIDKQLILVSNEDAPFSKVLSIKGKKFKLKKAQELIPEQDFALESVDVINSHLVCVYLKNVSSLIRIYDLEGNLKREVDLPVKGTVSMSDGRAKDPFVFLSLSSFAFPSVQYKLEVPSGKLNIHRESEIDIDASQFKTEQVFFKSTDGTEVPMYLVHKKGIEKNGEIPTLMYGYGGFNIAVKPSFQPNIIPFLEQGGMYVSVNLRGGSEYGETWHKQGMLENKQQVFDDFISAAEFLIEQGYTNSKKLGIYGRSNGGLLVGAVMTQRPDLFEVAIPSVGVLDMLRFHLFTIGYAWVPEYGSSEDEEQFKYLLKYSPYHNIKAGEKYPKTMVMTSMGDDRVVPYHSYKFAAKLQNQASKENPYLLWIETKAGHGSGKSLEQRLDEYIARWSFIMYHLGMEFKN